VRLRCAGERRLTSSQSRLPERSHGVKRTVSRSSRGPHTSQGTSLRLQYVRGGHKGHFFICTLFEECNK
jgi:hypothetical protein